MAISLFLRFVLNAAGAAVSPADFVGEIPSPFASSHGDGEILPVDDAFSSKRAT